MAGKDELYDPMVNYDSGSGDEDFELNSNNAKLSSSPPSCGNNRINDVFIHNNFRSGGPMMDGKETGEVPQAEGDIKETEVTEVPQAGDGKKKVQVTEVTKPEECWQPGETEDEKKRAREQGQKICENITPASDLQCPHPNRRFVGFFYDHYAYGCSGDNMRKFCYECATKTECPQHPTRRRIQPERNPRKIS